ncbi:hypothetical protein ACNVED_16145 (plasmid) [Legionella sp. D16C41]|uniref:hypothetical protein n=1 Tax=Legionella sp. D16C41 TaxID=3402688 RepID=UPI003AF88628
MKIKNDTSVKSDRSLINHDFLTSNATAVIGIYGYDNSSRSIYIELGKEERSITRYVITFFLKTLVSGKVYCSSNMVIAL